ncbi:unnamed protein product [Amoebophrya sp. A25]|nr:unnamed protein product [Amoebophrya sp. A25]|eukprot:GSA25T00001853001.1
MCGRDRLVLEADHMDEPFVPSWFAERGLRFRHVTTGPSFTICVELGGSVYAFGDNAKGQLGIGRQQPRVQVPEKLRLPERCFAASSAGSSHSMILSATGIAYGTGNRLSGRLALELGEGKQPKFIWSWHQNQAPWDEEVEDAEEPQADGQADGGEEGEEEEDAGQEEDTGGDEAAGGKQDVGQQLIMDLQKELKAEPIEHKEHQLRKMENRLSDEYSGFMDEIYSNYDEEEGPYRTYSKSKQTFEQKLVRLYKYLDLSNREPKLLERTRLHPEVQDRLLFFQQLINILQSQPAYLARLGSRTLPNLDSLWMRVVKCVFQDRGNIRVRTIFKALIRLVMKTEVESAIKFEEIFTPMSKTARLFEFLACAKTNWLPSADAEYVSVEGQNHDSSSAAAGGGGEDGESVGAQYGRCFSRILDFGNSRSLLSLLFAYTMQRQNSQKLDIFWALDAEGTAVVRTQAAADEMKELSGFGLGAHLAAQQEASGADALPGDEDEKRALYQQMGRLLSEFFRDSFFPEFFNKIHTLLSRDLSCILQRAYFLIEDQECAFHLTTKSSGKAMPDEKISLPMVNLVLGHYLAPLLMAAESFLTPSVRLTLRKKCRVLAEERLRLRRDQPRKDAIIAAKAQLLQKQFYQNAAVLGQVLQRTVTQQWNAGQNLMQGISLKQILPKCLAVITRAVAGPKQLLDTTETELTIDLYARHFNPRLSYVQASTSDILKLCNVFWTCFWQSDYDPDHADQTDVRTDPGNDVLERVLDAIMPLPPIGAGEKRPAKYKMLESRLWSRETIMIVEQTDSIHNIIVDHRFILHFRLLSAEDQGLPGPAPMTWRERFLLEDKKLVLAKDQKVALLNRMREVCFCRESQVSMPRFLTGRNQKARSGVRYLKVFQAASADLPSAVAQELKSALPPGMDAFRFLELLLEDISEVKSRDFLSLKYELEEKQRVYQSLVPPNFEIANRLETGKKVLDALKMEGIKEDEFVTFVMEGLQAREEHFVYLQQVENGKQKVNTQREDYRELMGVLASETQALAEFASTGDIAKAIRQKGMDYNLKLKIPAVSNRMKKEVGAALPAFRQYSMGYLRSKKVVVRLGEHISPDLIRNLFLEIHQVSEYLGKTVYNQFEIVVLHKDEKGARRNMLSFSVTMEELDLMRESSGKLAKMEWADRFITLQCNKLLQMLARI